MPTSDPGASIYMRLRRPRISDIAPQLFLEQGEPLDAAVDRVAVIAHYSDRPQISRSLQTLLSELTAAGYACAVVSTSDTAGRLLPADGTACIPATVFRRPNIGYDFGSWAAFLQAHPAVRSASRVILANDSLVGPFETIAPILEEFDTCPTDIWGLTGSSQDAPHLQSYLMGYKEGVLAGSRPLQQFWDSIRVQPSKRSLILAYEIGLSRLAQKSGLACRAHFPWQQTTTLGQNPTSQGWRRLILSGFPFVKRELVLRPPPEVPDADAIDEVVRQKWGQNVYEWV